MHTTAAILLPHKRYAHSLKLMFLRLHHNTTERFCQVTAKINLSQSQKNSAAHRENNMLVGIFLSYTPFHLIITLENRKSNTKHHLFYKKFKKRLFGIKNNGKTTVFPTVFPSYCNNYYFPFFAVRLFGDPSGISKNVRKART